MSSINYTGYPQWKNAGLGENFRTKSGLFEGLVGAPEESARDGDSLNVLPTDHVLISKPKSRTDSKFSAIKLLVSSIANHPKAVHRCEGLPDHAADLQRAQEVQDKLKDEIVLGFVAWVESGRPPLPNKCLIRFFQTLNILALLTM